MKIALNKAIFNYIMSGPVHYDKTVARKRPPEAHPKVKGGIPMHPRSKYIEFSEFKEVVLDSGVEHTKFYSLNFEGGPLKVSGGLSGGKVEPDPKFDGQDCLILDTAGKEVHFSWPLDRLRFSRKGDRFEIETTEPLVADRCRLTFEPI